MELMLGAHSRPNLLIVSAGVLLLLLGLAGVLIYRWIDRASEADRLQQKEFLETAMRSFEAEFSGAIEEIVWTFRPVMRLQADTAESYIADVYSQWQSHAIQPRLIGTVGLGTTTSDGAVIFRRFRREPGHFENQEWPASLRQFRDTLEQRTQVAREQPLFPPPGVTLALSEDWYGIVLPLLAVTPSKGGAAPTSFTLSLGSEKPPPAGPPERSRRPDQPPPLPFPSSPLRRSSGGPDWSKLSTRLRGWCFLQLDLEFLQQQFLPALVQRHFGGAGLSNYRLAVVMSNPRRMLFRSDETLTWEVLSSVDGTAMLFGPQRWLVGLGPPNSHRSHKQGREGTGVPPGASGGRVIIGGMAHEQGFVMEGTAFPAAPERPPDAAPHPAKIPDVRTRFDAEGWLLLAKHKSGSIETFVRATRRRNLAIGFGILALMGSGMALLVLNTHRARSLAKREMEFVASVSHELRTPLSVIQSAGFNLASGRISEASRVQEYGTVIQTESRRLSDMIEQVLSYAGIQSGRKRYELQPTEMSEIIDRALAEYATAFAEAGWQVEKQIEAHLPPVMADAQALESAIKNLLHNALKYAADGRWLGISARAAPDHQKREIEVTVADHGPGIDPQDLPHLFDPFYRGQGMVASSIPGVGLGLSLVQRHVRAHRGRVTVNTAPGQGAAFTLHLPALARAEEGETV